MSILLHREKKDGRSAEANWLGEKAEIVFKAFELDPQSPATSEETMQEVLAKKYGTSVEEAKKMTDNVSEQAKSVGLNYDFLR